jgi:diacylglycerol kinase (ATP)
MTNFWLRRLKSFKHAFEGIQYVISTQRNFQIHIIIALTASVLGLWLHISKIDWLFIILSIALVWALEIINTAIEVLVDFVSPEFHPLAGKVKDIAAGAVLVSAIAAVILGSIVFIPYLSERFGKV